MTPWPGGLVQHRHGPFPQHGSPGAVPAGHRGQVAVIDAHPVRQFLQVEAVPPGGSPKLALGLALDLSLCRSRYGVAVGVGPCLGVNAGSLPVASYRTQKAGPAQMNRPRLSSSCGFSVVAAAQVAAFSCRLVTPGATGLGFLPVKEFRQQALGGLDDLASPPRAGRAAPWVWRFTESRLGVCEGRSSATV